jgi:uncharacterized surface protein with fasciclin (FAS1) repeats
VPGRIDSKELAKKIKEGNGRAEFTTVAGGKLWATMEGSDVKIWDEKGGSAIVTIKDVYQSNGVIHVINKVVMPK